MKSLSLIAVVATSLVAVVFSGCSSCSQEKAEKAAPPVTCGRGTVSQGGQCVGTVQNR